MHKIKTVAIFSLAGLLIYVSLVTYLCSANRIAYLINDSYKSNTYMVSRSMAEFFLFNFRGTKKDITELKTEDGGLNYVVSVLDSSNFSKRKKLKYIRFFISKGCGVNDISNIDGLRPIHTAVSDGNAEVVELLLENGADPLLRTDPSGIVKNMTPLELAELLKKKNPHADYNKVIEVLRKAEASKTRGV